MSEKRKMTLGECKEIVLKWVRSCFTSEQLDLMEEVVEEFIVKRFSLQIDKEVRKEDKPGAIRELHMAQEEISKAIVNERVIVAGTRKKIRLKSQIAAQ